MGQNTDIVITHYNESLDWLNDFHNDNVRHIWVYSKGSEILYGHHLNAKIINLYYPNYGGDSLVHLNHVVRHYDNMPENIIFMQSNLNPHIRVNDEWCNTTCNKTKTNEFVEWMQTNEYTNNYQLTEIWDCLSLSGNDGGCHKWFSTGTCENLHECLNENNNPNCKVKLKGKIEIDKYMNKLVKADLQLYEWTRQRFDLNVQLYPPYCKVPIFWGNIIGLKSKHIIRRAKSVYENVIQKDFTFDGVNIHTEYNHYYERILYFAYNLHEVDNHKFSVVR